MGMKSESTRSHIDIECNAVNALASLKLWQQRRHAKCKLDAPYTTSRQPADCAYPFLAVAMQSLHKVLEVCQGVAFTQHKDLLIAPSLSIHDHSLQWDLCQGVVFDHLLHIFQGQVA